MANYRIAFKKGDISFELESNDKVWLKAKEKEYMELIGHPNSMSTPTAGIPKTSSLMPLSSNLTVVEFYKKYVKHYKITARPDIAVFFVYYLEKIVRKDAISSSDVTGCFSQIGYPNYNKLNMTDILNQAKRRALLNNVNKNWAVTITGEDYVLNVISGEEK